MLVSVFVSTLQSIYRDNPKIYLYIPFQAGVKSGDLLDNRYLNEEILDQLPKFEMKFALHVNTAKQKLIQIKDLEAFEQKINEQGYYLYIENKQAQAEREQMLADLCSPK